MNVPPPPEPLPDEWLFLRKHGERKFEREDRAKDERLREIQAWAKHMLARAIVAQDNGADEGDEQYMDLVDEMYDTIRNSLTRQDLIRGFLINVQEGAYREAARINLDFRAELDALMPGGVTVRKDGLE